MFWGSVVELALGMYETGFDSQRQKQEEDKKEEERGKKKRS